MVSSRYVITKTIPPSIVICTYGQNLKKSWHPSTFQNLEKVWKAEQRRDQEKKKIEQLQQEIREERSREDIHRAAVDSGLIK